MTQLHPSTPDPTGDALDRLLDAHLAGASEELAPSSGFVASVMESIQAEASEPPPIAFPWRRVLPGIIAVLGGLLALLVFVIREAGTPSIAHSSTTASRPHLNLAFPLNPSELAVGLIVAAALISIAAVAASLRLAGRS